MSGWVLCPVPLGSVEERGDVYGDGDEDELCPTAQFGLSAKARPALLLLLLAALPCQLYFAKCAASVCVCVSVSVCASAPVLVSWCLPLLNWDNNSNKAKSSELHRD